MWSGKTLAVPAPIKAESGTAHAGPQKSCIEKVLAAGPAPELEPHHGSSRIWLADLERGRGGVSCDMSVPEQVDVEGTH